MILISRTCSGELMRLIAKKEEKKKGLGTWECVRCGGMQIRNSKKQRFGEGVGRGLSNLLGFFFNLLSYFLFRLKLFHKKFMAFFNQLFAQDGSIPKRLATSKKPPSSPSFPTPTHMSIQPSFLAFSTSSSGPEFPRSTYMVWYPHFLAPFKSPTCDATSAHSLVCSPSALAAPS